MARLAFWLALFGLIFQTAPVAVSLCACAPSQALEKPLCVPCGCCDQATVPAALTSDQPVFQASPIVSFAFPIGAPLIQNGAQWEMVAVCGGAIERAVAHDLPPPRQLYGPIFSCRAPPVFSKIA